MNNYISIFFIFYNINNITNLLKPYYKIKININNLININNFFHFNINFLSIFRFFIFSTSKKYWFYYIVILKSLFLLY